MRITALSAVAGAALAGTSLICPTDARATPITSGIDPTLTGMYEFDGWENYNKSTVKVKVEYTINYTIQSTGVVSFVSGTAKFTETAGSDVGEVVTAPIYFSSLEYGVANGTLQVFALGLEFDGSFTDSHQSDYPELPAESMDGYIDFFSGKGKLVTSYGGTGGPFTYTTYIPTVPEPAAGLLLLGSLLALGAVWRKHRPALASA